MIPNIILTASAIGIVYFNWVLYKLNRDNNRERHEIKMKMERNQQVYQFRYRMIHTFGAKVVECMPSYDDMQNSTKELTASNWIEVDALVLSDVIAINEPLKIERGMMVVYNAN